MNKRLSTIVATVALLLSLGVTAASAHAGSYASANVAAEHGDIVDMLREVPPETLQGGS